MKPESWQYITSNWASADEHVMERVAQLRAESDAEMKKMKDIVEEREKRIKELETQSINLHNTNMTLQMKFYEEAGTMSALEPEVRKVSSIDAYDEYIEM